MCDDDNMNLYRPTREQRRQLKQDNKKWPTYLLEIPESQWPQRQSTFKSGPTRVWRSSRFAVQAYPADAPAIVRLTVNRTEIAGDRWSAEISWDELQQIKNEAGYGDWTAVEIFPPDCEIVNVANMRHLWILPSLPEYAWRRRST